jgi:hypothetical protein
MAEKVTQYCALMRDRLNDLSFEQRREVLDALLAQLTLDKEGELRILLVLPTSESASFCTTSRRASGYIAQGRTSEGVTLIRTVRLK